MGGLVHFRTAVMSAFEAMGASALASLLASVTSSDATIV